MVKKRILLLFQLFHVSDKVDPAATSDKQCISSVEAMKKAMMLSTSIDWIYKLGPIGNKSKLHRLSK